MMWRHNKARDDLADWKEEWGREDGFLYFFFSNNVWRIYIAGLQEEREERKEDDRKKKKKSHPIYVFGHIKRSQYFKRGVEKRVG